MNCGIIIFENDDHLYRLLKFRLSTYFPDGYIVRGNIGTVGSSDIPLADQIHILYDSDQFSYEQICKETEDIELKVSISSIYNEEITKGKIIDCKYLAKKILQTTSPLIHNTSSGKGQEPDRFIGKTIMLFPYAYMDEREHLIDTEFDYLRSSCNMCLRLDLMSGIRMPSIFSSIDNSGSGLSDLLELASTDRLEPKDIMEHSTPCSGGFITPGRPRHSDDVFDYGIDNVLKLIEAATELTTDLCLPINVFIVAEGFRFSETAKMATLADEVHFLLPKRLMEEDLGFKEEIGSITRMLPAGTPVTMHYSDIILKSRQHDKVKI